MASLPAPHARHKLIKKRLSSSHSHASLPTDHSSAAFRLTPWPAHTVLPVPRGPPAPPRRRERERTAGQSLLYVLGHIDREDGYSYTPKVVLDLFGGQKQYKLNTDARLVRSLDAIPGPRPLRPLHHVSGPRPLTPPPGPIPVNPSQVVLDARELIDRSRNQQLERQRQFLKRVRPPPPLPDPWPPQPLEDPGATFRATCVGCPAGPPMEVSTLQLKLEQARQKIKNSTHKRPPKLLGSLSIERKQKCHAKRQRPGADHLVLVSSSLVPNSSHPDIISLCHLRESLQKLKQKGNQRIK